MNSTAEPHRRAKQQYEAVRQYLTSFEERVVAPHWGEDAFVRVSFQHFLDSLDRFAGWLLPDNGEPEPRAEDPEARTEEPQARVEEPQARVEEPSMSAEEPLMPDEPAAEARPVDVTFTLPAEVHADSVALCGEFNQWSPEAIQLERGGDGTWRTTVALEPGRSYRYRYLLDGERWENAPQADRYVPNPYGTVDSVVIVEPHQEN